MLLLVGLGNVGEKYDLTRHNAGFMLVDLLLNLAQKGEFSAADSPFFQPQTSQKISHKNPQNQRVSQTNGAKDAQKTKFDPQKLAQSFKNAKLSCLTSEKFFGEVYKFGELMLLKPSTFMNLSGKSVQAVTQFFKPDRVIIAHDDIDLKLGALRFKKGGSSGGHNGIKSIDAAIGSDYERIRLGVGSPNEATKASNQNSPLASQTTFTPNAIDFVLGKFTQSEVATLNQTLSVAAKLVLHALSGETTEKLASQFSLKGV